jgi:hypothetical protein
VEPETPREDDQGSPQVNPHSVFPFDPEWLRRQLISEHVDTPDVHGMARTIALYRATLLAGGVPEQEAMLFTYHYAKEMNKALGKRVANG